MRTYTRKPLADRFWARVQKTETCWLFNGAKDEGYGAMNIDSKFHKERTHRISWELHFGPIPDGLFVLHKCDVRLCVNPAHLFLGTRQDNHRDMTEKGRNGVWSPKGSKNPSAKLTEKQVLDIRAQHAKGVLGVRLAEAYGVTKTTVSDIIKRRIWANI